MSIRCALLGTACLLCLMGCSMQDRGSRPISVAHAAKRPAAPAAKPAPPVSEPVEEAPEPILTLDEIDEPVVPVETERFEPVGAVEVATDVRTEVPHQVRTREADAFLQQYAATYRFRLGTPRNLTMLPDASGVLFLRSGSRDFVNDLYLFDCATGEEQLLLTAEDLLGGMNEDLSAEELARRERQRVTARGIATFVLSEDGARVLVPLSGDLYLYEMETREFRRLESTSGYPIDPRFSKDGRHVSCVRNGELYVTDLTTGGERRLTWDATEHITNGLAEFVAQEEMDRDEGYWWSPDSRRLLYQRTDTSAVEMMYIMDPKNPERAPKGWPYPRPGRTNATVELFILDMESGGAIPVQWDREGYPYLARVVWPDAGLLTILVQNRHQTEQKLLVVDPFSGGTRTLLSERDNAWLNIDAQMPVWSEDGRFFFWTTERNNGWQLEMRDRSGALVSELTPRRWGYRRFIAFHEEDNEVWWVGSPDPTEAQIYVSTTVEADPRRPPQRITRTPGLHGATFASDNETYIHTVTTLSGSSDRIVRHRDGTIYGTIQSAAEEPPMPVNLELTTVGDGPTWHCAIVRPNDFDPTRKYPVLVSVYGGPHAQVVQASRQRYVLQQWFADHGFVVVCIDGRGTPNRGRLWERAIKGDFIGLPLDDQATALKLLAGRYPELDAGRVGIYGWSFGGYFSAMAVMRRPDVFHAGVAGAPVCDWLDYDTHYTERYLGLPDENPSGYRDGNVLTWAADLTRPLLIIHGTADDNVFFTHSLRMSDELTRHGIEHEFLPLAGMTHMVSDPDMTVTLYERMRDFFVGRLRNAGENP